MCLEVEFEGEGKGEGRKEENIAYGQANADHTGDRNEYSSSNEGLEKEKHRERFTIE